MIPFQAPQIALYSISIGCMLLTILCLTIGLIEPTIVLFRTKEKTRTKVFYLYSYLAISGFICVFIFGKKPSQNKFWDGFLLDIDALIHSIVLAKAPI